MSAPATAVWLTWLPERERDLLRDVLENAIECEAQSLDDYVSFAHGGGVAERAGERARDLATMGKLLAELREGIR